MANKNGVKKPVARRNRKNIDKGEAHIHSSFNNTIVTITDTKGNIKPVTVKRQWTFFIKKKISRC